MIHTGQNKNISSKEACSKFGGRQEIYTTFSLENLKETEI